MNLEEYCSKLYDYNEKIKGEHMRTCKATFTIIDDEDNKLNRTEVIEMVFSIDDDSNMIDSMLDYLSEEEESETAGSSIITNH